MALQNVSSKSVIDSLKLLGHESYNFTRVFAEDVLSKDLCTIARQVQEPQRLKSKTHFSVKLTLKALNHTTMAEESLLMQEILRIEELKRLLPMCILLMSMAEKIPQRSSIAKLVKAERS